MLTQIGTFVRLTERCHIQWPCLAS